MSVLNRREFIKQSAGVLATTVAISGMTHAEISPPVAAGRKSLGNTGLTPSLLGIGTGTHAWDGKSDQNRQGREAFVRTLIHGYERGLRYYDMAGMYGSHDYLKDAIKQGGMERAELMLLTKSVAKDAKTLRADIDRFRRELNTDYIDVLLMHCMTAPNWTEQMKPCMDVLAEAKEKGDIRAQGVSCHSFKALELASRTDWVDVILTRINPLGVKMDKKADRKVPLSEQVNDVVKILRQAHNSGKGILGMKILGEGRIADRIDESLKFVLRLDCVDAITIGFMTPDQIDDAIERIERGAPADLSAKA